MEKFCLIKKIKVCIVFLLTLCTATVFAQNIAITGTVTDEKGDLLPGVNIIIKGTALGTASGPDGAFSMNVPNEQSVLVFTYIGYISQEIQVGSLRNIPVIMQEDLQQIDEVVVVGYGTQRKINMTGAVGTVNAKELISRVAPNTSTLLQGRVAGLQIVQNSAMPGNESVEIRIRGMGSYGSTNNPLILIDGVEADFNKVNPNVIESISVLKDAASAAIYGARAANGVILVTTKAGREGDLRVDYSFNYSLQKPTTPLKRITNSIEYMEMINKAIGFSNLQTGWTYTPEQIELYRNGQNPSHPSYNMKQYPNCDWMDYLLRDAPIQQHFVSLHGGKGGTIFNVGLGYLDEDGITIATSYKRYDFQLNMKSQISKRVTFGANINLNYGKRTDTRNGAGDQMVSTYAATPLVTPQLADGSGRWTGSGDTTTAWPGKGGNKNPIAVALAGGGVLYDENYVLASSYLNVEIFKGLNAEIKGGVRFNEQQQKTFNAVFDHYGFHPDVNGNHPYYPATSRQSFNQTNSRSKFYTLYGTLNYTKSFLDEHNLNVMGGYSMELYQTESISGSRTDYSTSNMWYLSAGPSEGATNGSSVGEWALMSFFGRLNYDFKNKYLLEANFRYDGSSRLHPDGRWGMFPSVSAGWRISEEDFFNVDIINSLKLRGSWGVLGNYGSSNYQYQAMLSSGAYSIDGVRTPLYYAGSMVNDKIKWETTTTSDIGFDFSLWKSKLYGSVDYYNKYTRDIIRTLQVPSFVGVNGPNVNSGEMKNTGWEFDLGHDNRIGDLFYSLKFNLGTFKNTLVKFGEDEISGAQIRREGLPWNTFYVLVQDGIYQNQAEIDNATAADGTPIRWGYLGSAKPQPGDIKYKNVSGPNGVPDASIDANYDRVAVSGVFPKFSYSFNLSADYKGFDLTMFFQGVQGRKILVNGWGIEPFNQAAPPPVFWRNAWDGEGTSDFIPHIHVNGHSAMQANISSFYLRDASYLRLKNLQLGYTVPSYLTKKILIQNLRAYVSGDNILTFTKFFDGQIDPERTGTSNTGTGGAIYPQARIYSIGLKATF